MRTAWAIAKREFNTYFVSPVAYVVAFAVLLIVGILFLVNVVVGGASTGGAPDFSDTTNLFAFLMLFVIPAITMRLLSEEQRSGTLELLLTAPVNEWELVLGKWLGAFGFMAVLIFSTALYAVVLNGLVTPGLDLNKLLANYLGLVLFVGALIAIGLCISAFFANQIAAFFVVMATLLAGWIIDAPFQPGSGGLADFFAYLSLSNHYYNNFPNGVVDVGDVVFFVSIAALFLFIATRVVESRRWR